MLGGVVSGRGEGGEALVGREGTLLRKPSSGLGQHGVQQPCRGKIVSEKKGEGPEGALEEAKGRSRGACASERDPAVAAGSALQKALRQVSPKCKEC